MALTRMNKMNFLSFVTSRIKKKRKTLKEILGKKNIHGRKPQRDSKF